MIHSSTENDYKGVKKCSWVLHQGCRVCLREFPKEPAGPPEVLSNWWLFEVLARIHVYDVKHMFPGCVMLPQTLRSLGRQTLCGLCHGEPSGLSGRRTKPIQVECTTSHQDADNGHWSQGRFPGWVNQRVGGPARISAVMAPTLPTHLILATGSTAHLFLSVLHCKTCLEFSDIQHI